MTADDKQVAELEAALGLTTTVVSISQLTAKELEALRDVKPIVRRRKLYPTADGYLTAVKPKKSDKEQGASE